VRTLQLVAADLGIELTDADIWPTLGVPLHDALSPWLSGARLEEAVADYRRRYPTTGVPLTTGLPGAREAMAAVHALGGRAAGISARPEPAVRAVLDHVGLDADEVVGGRFAEGKAEVLRDLRAQVYVGDHPGDMVAAVGSAAVGVAVTTGPTSAEDLRAAG